MELFGYDFMIDDRFNPWLIEINSSPCMEYSTKITERLVKKVLEDTIKVVIDYTYVKKGSKKNIDTGGFKLIYKGDGIINVYNNKN
jgi:tubulin monoglycylase TTLL3/8